MAWASQLIRWEWAKKNRSLTASSSAPARTEQPFVVGSRGARGLRRLLLGSVASAVARDARCSVLVARPRL